MARRWHARLCSHPPPSLPALSSSMAALNGGDSATSRTIDVELGVDVISVDLDNLDPDASDILDLLREAESPVWIWVRFASEYWRKGHLTTAEDICQAAIQGQGSLPCPLGF